MASRSYTLKGLDAVQCGKTAALLIAIIALIQAVIGLVISLFTGSADAIGAWLIGLLVAVIVVPIVAGILVVIGCWLYNFVASKVGGYKVTLEIQE
ncbi:MAG: hypothetical protein KKB81_06185 [Candidatus Margulisbacteria bacterium]|nr:hypothetical protein [Candidatus Margulisiibacteriota bacterium]MBU1021447.1 hypothetical protein [Candidatus Margulisiibacteriota bacterium]MBU1728368.1 hypothetical protein [Candidatus Margulisiibacteriota bacterium]MBU1955889.1 hypothetical protein [Candidatus Margulisiibacteriota bacterium]